MTTKTLWILVSKDSQRFHLKEARAVACESAAKKKNLSVKRIYIEDIHLDTKNQEALPQQGDALISFVSHIAFGMKSLQILRFFEDRNVCMLNSIETIQTINDKWLTTSKAAAHDITVPRTKLITINSFTSNDFADMHFPVVAKTAAGSLGKGVFWCEDQNILEDLLEFSNAQQPPKNTLLVQEAITESKGFDIRVIVLQGKILGAIKRSNEVHAFKANMHFGAQASLYPIDSKLKNAIQKTIKAFDLTFGGLDFLVGKDGEYFLTEINEQPGFEGFQSIHTNIDLGAEIVNAISKKAQL